MNKNKKIRRKNLIFPANYVTIGLGGNGLATVPRVKEVIAHSLPIFIILYHNMQPLFKTLYDEYL